MAGGPLTDVMRTTLALFDESGEPQTTTEIAERLDLGRRATYGRLDRLVDRGRLRTKKVGANARVWWRPAEPPDRSSPEWPEAAESLAMGSILLVGVVVPLVTGPLGASVRGLLPDASLDGE
ncbi:hypothetical protein [Halosimplex sp. TS25]|uniref:hypothetical protein n=1 Tax=Halosimplex rarum TaxID=3396619 RepID=UPI0039ED19ED